MPKYHGGTLELTAKTPESFVKLGQTQIYVQLQKEKKKKKSDLIILHAQNRFDGFIIFFFNANL